MFPLDVNSAPREALLRVPGLGVRAVDRLLEARRHTRLRFSDLARLTPGLKRARAFLLAADYTPANLTDRANLRDQVVPRQMSLFG
jgi:predicted DNA-binding helix-hairpin-helix protein